MNGGWSEDTRSRRLLPGDARDELDDDPALPVPDVVERPPPRLALRPLARGDLLHPHPAVLLQLRACFRDAEGDVVQPLAVLLEEVAPGARAVPERLHQLDHRPRPVDERLLERDVDRLTVVGPVGP